MNDEDKNREMLLEFLDKLSENVSESQKEYFEEVKQFVKKLHKQQTDFFKNVADDASVSFDELAKKVNTLDDDISHYRKVHKQAAKIVDQYTSIIGESVRATASFVNSVSTGSESVGAFSTFINPLGSIIETVISSAGMLASTIVGTVGEFGIMEDTLGSISKGLNKFGEYVGKVAGTLFKFAANIALDSIDKMWGMFTSATEAGLLYTNGMTKMVWQLQDMNLNMAQYAALVKQTSEQLVQFGGSVAGGMDKMHAVMRYYGEQADLMREYGITYEEQAERTAEFLQMMERSSQARALSDQQLATMSLEYMKNLKVISALTGKTADEMKKEREEAMQNLAWQQKIREISRTDPEAAQRLNAALNEMPKGMHQAFKESIIFGKVMTDVGAITTGVAGDIEQFARNIITGSEDVKLEYENFRDSLRNRSEEIMQNVDQLAVVGMAGLVGKDSPVSKAINDFAYMLTDVVAASRNTNEKILAEAIKTTQGETSGSQGVSGVVAKMRDVTVEAAKLTLTQVSSITKLMDGMVAAVRSSFRLMNPATRETEMNKLKGAFAESGAEQALNTTLEKLNDAILPLIGASGAFALLKSSTLMSSETMLKWATRIGGPLLAYDFGSKIGTALYENIKGTELGTTVSNAIGILFDKILYAFGSRDKDLLKRLNSFENSVAQPTYTPAAPKRPNEYTMLQEEQWKRERDNKEREDFDITRESAANMTYERLAYEMGQTTTSESERKILVDTLQQLARAIEENNKLNNASNITLTQIQQSLQ